MKQSDKFLCVAIVATLPIDVTGYSSVSEQDKGAAIGTGAGGVTVSVLTSGSSVRALDDIAVGGAIGNQVGK